MAKLINNIADLKRHIVVSATFDFEKVLPHAKRIERKLILDLIGRAQYDDLVIHALDLEADTPIDQVKNLLEEAISHLALFQALPTINMLITNSGTKVSDNKDASNADWKDKLDLNRYLIKTYNEALDDAFKIMEENVAEFQSWATSKFYTIFKDLIVYQTGIFNEHFTIHNNRQTFIALKPVMREVEDQYFIGMLGDCTLDFLKTKSANPIVLRAQELSHKAVVALSVAKAAEGGGTFSFTDSAMTIVSDAMPWEKKQQLSDDKLSKLQMSRQKAGEEYLKNLKKIIVENPLVFICYEDKKEKGIGTKLIKKKSGLWL